MLALPIVSDTLSSEAGGIRRHPRLADIASTPPMALLEEAGFSSFALAVSLLTLLTGE